MVLRIVGKKTMDRRVPTNLMSPRQPGGKKKADNDLQACGEGRIDKSIGKTDTQGGLFKKHNVVVQPDKLPVKKGPPCQAEEK